MLGSTLGRYRIDAELGRGGMGVVYKATQMTLDREVAIKMLSPHLAESGEYLVRFRREAEVLARLQHENIVRIYDVEEVEGSFCIVMEFVAGPSLGEVLHREGRLEEGRVRDIALALCAGLDAAHRKGIVHRDLKPDNILFTPEGLPKLTDFGIARIAGDDAMARTRTGILMGTPYYMSPEQARGEQVTGTSDLYALGVLVHEMLSGSVPFEGTDPISLAIKHIQETPPPLREVAPGVHPTLVEVVDRALQKDPANRFPDAGEMARALRRVPVAETTGALPWDGSHAPERGRRREGGARVQEPFTSACPACGTAVLSGFLTCPRCGVELGGGDAPSASDPRVEPKINEEVAATADVGDGGHDPGGPRLRGPASPPSPSPVARLYAALTGARDALHRWNQPGGRWNLPPLLLAGVALVVLGLTVGLGRAMLPWSSAGVERERAEGHAASGVPADGSGIAEAAGGGGGGGPTVARIFDPSPFSGEIRTLPASPGAGSPRSIGGEGAGSGSDRGVTPDGAGPRSRTEAGSRGAERTEAAPSEASVRTEPGGATGPGSEASEAGPDPAPPAPAFEADRAQAELLDLVERQRRATESGDPALFARDLAPPLAQANLPFLAQLHAAWKEIQSEIWNLAIQFEGESRALVDFHTQITGIPRGGPGRQIIEDTHVYWILEARGSGWAIVDARSAPHEESHR